MAAMDAPLQSAALAGLPRHLRQYLVPQRHERYTAQDHALWRYILRGLTRVLAGRAHPAYARGLASTGIALEAIPRVEEMDAILGRLGWGAACVAGFIPPAAFMELQAHRVLPIAADMRRIEHLEYTPAPDIVHEAAGHAPMIADAGYASYLQAIGEVGAKAIASRQDHELYEAIRRLSELKEASGVDAGELARAEREVSDRQAGGGPPSEMALISRLHWWSVEYGLIGALDRPQIYGAGLLSSIGEAVSCLGAGVEKRPFSLEAAEVAYDITRPQPQLFVTPSFEHLSAVLEQLAEGMAFRAGGAGALKRAIASERVATVEWSSGLQASGVVSRMIADEEGRPAYVSLAGPAALAHGGRELPGEGRARHADGFGSPAGRVRGFPLPLESLDERGLAAAGLTRGRDVALDFESGVAVRGCLEAVERRGGAAVLLRFSNCRVSLADEVLFRPEWGAYDLAVGERIASVFGGAADRDAYEPGPTEARERSLRVIPDTRRRALDALYARVRDLRERGGALDELPEIWDELRREHPDEWLLPLEMLEVLELRGGASGLGEAIRGALGSRAELGAPARP